jgi:hypothetical protein
VWEDSEEVTHLRRLAAELVHRNLSARVVTSGRQSYVQVANPDTPELNERVLCGRTEADGLFFWWPWRQPIGLVSDQESVISKIAVVLRPVEGQS